MVFVKTILVAIITILFCSTSSANMEERVIAYADDGVQAWFTFEYNSKDKFTLSFAGSGVSRGVWIVNGQVLNPSNTLCMLETEDPDRKLQNLIKDQFVPKYGFSGSIDVNPDNTMTAVKGKISNTILYFFLRAAQDSDNTKSYLKKLGC